MSRRTYTVADYRRDLARISELRRVDAPGLRLLLAERVIDDAELAPPSASPPSSAPPQSGPRLRQTPAGGFVAPRQTIPAGPAALRACGLGKRPSGRLRCSALAVALAVLALVLGGGTGCLPQSVESVTLTPTSSEVEAALLAADARWEAAGVAPDRIVIGPGGAPVRHAPERETSVTMTLGHDPAFGDEVFTGVEWIELNSLSLDMVTHELGHALGVAEARFDETHVTGAECAADAPTRPVMCLHVGSAITEADLDLACEAGDCLYFNPELRPAVAP